MGRKMSTVMFMIDAVFDIRVRTHSVFEYVLFEAECYDECITLLDSADARLRIGNNYSYTWNHTHWDGQRLESFITLLDLLDDDKYKLNVLTEGHLFQQGVLVL
jgi:hypothetical protein